MQVVLTPCLGGTKAGCKPKNEVLEFYKKNKFYIINPDMKLSVEDGE
jgi:hypothetical protein